jgi:hypothetical protein
MKQPGHQMKNLPMIIAAVGAMLYGAIDISLFPENALSNSGRPPSISLHPPLFYVHTGENRCIISRLRRSLRPDLPALNKQKPRTTFVMRGWLYDGFACQL